MPARHGTPQARLLDKLTVAQARELRATGVLGASSMAPKEESAVDYITATGRAARMLHKEELARALGAEATGTVIVP